MKKILPLILTLTISAALLMSCTASAQRMEAAEANAAYAEPTLQPEVAAPANAPAEQRMPTASSDLCAVCADADCDGGQSCNSADERQEYRKCKTPCKVCGDDNCDGGTYCGGRDNRHDNHHGGHHGKHHHNN